jgi:hypothetical protein
VKYRIGDQISMNSKQTIQSGVRCYIVDTDDILTIQDIQGKQLVLSLPDTDQRFRLHIDNPAFRLVTKSRVVLVDFRTKQVLGSA